MRIIYVIALPTATNKILRINNTSAFLCNRKNNLHLPDKNFIRSVYDNNPQRNISAKTDLFQCTAICVDGGTQDGYSCDASQGNFLCIENLFPTHRKNISLAEKFYFRCVAIRFCLATLSVGGECEIFFGHCPNPHTFLS